ncbi:MAG TPA: 7-cyano-7-deazaguanine synthase [Polyangiaceae bacterium]|nr:7-cyano-7-deazaguanine synthase [Polyangiaceae bacterium]HVZ31571.1 7-cyano-7-deazaguanine synthase [Polyangiaceae bacterium]
MAQRIYAYDADRQGYVREQPAAADRGLPMGSIRAQGVQGDATWLGAFDRSARDLVRVASAVLAADRLSMRHTLGAKGIQRELEWQRAIDLRMCVEDVDRWNSVSSDLAALLHFMTDDDWNLSFVSAGPVAVQQTLFPGDIRDVAEVALFSGGLDSVLGTYVRGQQLKGKILAVSACGTDVRGRAQADALECLRTLGVSTRWLRLENQLRNKQRTRRKMEPSQRSRSLLFLAMGAAVASSLGLETFQTYETGIGCLNLPLSAGQVGSQGTKAMHPFTLQSVNALFRALLDRPVRVTAPFFFITKGQLCRSAGVALEPLSSVSTSCDEGEGHKANSMEHCGVCTSCLFRRIAIAAATPGKDPTRYRDFSSSKHGEYELRLFEQHARALARCRGFDDLVSLDPDVRYAAAPPVEPAVPAQEAQERTFAAFRTYAREISDFLSTARPILQPRPVRTRKEEHNDLFAAVG